MKRTTLSIMILFAALLFATKAAPAQNDAPTMEALMDVERQAAFAAAKGDTRFFEGMLSDQFIAREGRERVGKALYLELIRSENCDIKTFVLDEPTLTKIAPDGYVLIYRSTMKGTCTDLGGTPADFSDSPYRSATVWVRKENKWLAAFHGSNTIIDPKDAPKAAKAKLSKAKRPDAITTRLAALETSVWQAWKDHDRKRLESLVADSIAFVDIFGNAYADRADIITAWSSGICKVRSVAVTDAVSFSLSPTVKLLTHTGTANGTCYGTKIGPIYGNSIYVRSGKTWKLAFTMNMPAE